MSLHNWLRNLRSAFEAGRGQRRDYAVKRRLVVESLEDRCVPAQYAVTDLGSHGYPAYAYDLNEAGQVVGYSDTANGLQRHAVLWDNGMMIDLGAGSAAYGINDLGQVVGSANGRAFLITPQGGAWFQDNDLDGRNDFMIDLGTLPGSTSSKAIDINNAGQVIGNSGDRAFIWDAVNGMTDLGVPAGFTSSNTAGINASGQVTGLASDVASGARSVFLWDAARGMTALGSGPEDTPTDFADYTVVKGINDSGQILGYQQGWAGPEWVASFMWLPDSPNGTTGDFSLKTTYRTLTDINNHGEEIGSEAGVLAYGPDGILDYQLLPGSNVNTLHDALAINDGGAIVAYGVAKRQSDVYQLSPFLLTPVPAGAPSISIANALAVTEGNAGTVAVAFTVTLSAACTAKITVAYATADSGASAGSDYQAASGTLTFAPGETSKAITLTVYGDTLVEGDEVFSVNLSNAVGATILDGQGLGTIINDDVPPPPPPPAPTISISDVTKAEGRKGQKTLFTFTVMLSAPSSETVTISYRTVNGTATTGDKDYVAKSGTITFAPGETEKTITIEVKGDNKREADEVFYLDLYDASGESLFAKSRGVGTIVNDD